VKKHPWKSPKGAWVGKVRILADIANRDTANLWDVVRQAEGKKLG
jgi:hypothetical protein